MQPILNARERFLVSQLDDCYRRRFNNSCPSLDENLVYFLGDRYEFGVTWSAISGKIPTYRCNSGLYIQRQSMKHLTSLDKMASLGWPVTPQAASAMGTTQLPAIDRLRASALAGNSMHFSCASFHLLLGLVCFGKTAVR